MSFNLHEEEICGHIVSSDMKKLWDVEMDIAREILRVCKKHNLKIWAEGGTLLGAVRHKGFIPWDDDMDFVMMRKDYERFKEIGPYEFKEPYFFQSFDTDNFPGSHVKIHRNDTAMIDSSYQERKKKHYGIFVDVIVMDGVPDEKNVFQKEYKKALWTLRLLNRYCTCLDDYSSMRAFFRTIATKLYFLFNNYKKVRKNHIKALAAYDVDETVECAKIEVEALLQIPFEKVSRRKHIWYNETIELPFHDMTLPAPKEYAKILTSQFGPNYMTPLKVPNGHTIIKYDTSRSYVDILKELNNNHL